MPRGTTLRNFRADDVLWARAKAVAEKRGESLSDVLRSALVSYADEGTTTQPRRADSLVTGDVLADGGRVTRPWKMYLVGNGYGSVEIDGRRRKFFRAEAVEVVE